MVSAADLTADLYFLSALRAAADCSRTRLLPLADLKSPLAPHDRFAQRILLALQSLGYIEPELSLSCAEDWLDSRDGHSRGFENVSWRILRSPAPAIDALQRWVDERGSSPSTLMTWAAIWEDLALAEVVEYTRCLLTQSGFNADWANEATGALRAGIEKFSVHQVMYLIYISLRSLALEQRRTTSRAHKPGQLFSSALRNYVHRASTDRWKIRNFARASDLPRSVITELFAETVTGLGERYYTERPSLQSLANAFASGQTQH